MTVTAPGTYTPSVILSSPQPWVATSISVGGTFAGTFVDVPNNAELDIVLLQQT
jgi:hypothetical protein